MKFKHLFLALLTSILFASYTYSQDLHIQFWGDDQKDDRIKTVWVTDQNGIKKEKNFPAKSHIHVIKIFESKGYKVSNIQVTEYHSNKSIKYHIWFDKIELEDQD